MRFSSVLFTRILEKAAAEKAEAEKASLISIIFSKKTLENWIFKLIYSTIQLNYSILILYLIIIIFFVEDWQPDNQCEPVTKNLRKCTVSGVHIILPYTQHLQDMFINFNKITFKARLLTVLRWIKYTFKENRE